MKRPRKQKPAEPAPSNVVDFALHRALAAEAKSAAPQPEAKRKPARNMSGMAKIALEVLLTMPEDQQWNVIDAYMRNRPKGGAS